MGLLDEVGSLLGGGQHGGGNIMALAQQLLAQSGGLQGLLEKLQQGGLADAAASWVGAGQNLPVTGEQIQKALGSGQVQELAAKLGLDVGQLSAQLAQHLPGLVDKLTPNGQLPQGNDVLAQGADLLKGFFKS
ncbi:MAG: YidB family protein [Moraxellaceae bacterium]